MTVTRRRLLLGTLGTVCISAVPAAKADGDTDEATATFEAAVDGFSDRLRADDDFLFTTAEAVADLKHIDELKAFEFEEAETAADDLKRFAVQGNQVVRLLNDDLGLNLSTSYLDTVNQKASEAQKIAPLASSVANVVRASDDLLEAENNCASQDTIDDRRFELYLAVLLLVAEVCLLKVAVGYRTAFYGTRYVNNAGLVRIRRFMSIRAYALLLSHVHWTLRTGVGGLTSALVTRWGEATATVLTQVYDTNDGRIREAYNDVPQELPEHDLEFDFLDEYAETDENDDGFLGGRIDWDFDLNGFLTDLWHGSDESC